MSKSFVVLLIFLFNSHFAFATHIDFNLLYFSDSFATDTTTTNSRTEYDLGIGTELTNDKQWVVALSTGSASFTDSDGTTDTTFTNSDTGMKLIYYFVKSRSWGSSLTYNFISKAKYNNGSGEVEFRGSSIKADLGYTFWGDSWGLSINLNYYAPSFIESVSASTITDISYKRTLIYPGIGFVFQN